MPDGDTESENSTQARARTLNPGERARELDEIGVVETIRAPGHDHSDAPRVEHGGGIPAGAIHRSGRGLTLSAWSDL